MMNIKKVILSILFLFSTIHVMGQGFTYSFEDPCTLKTKQIYINNPNGSITLSYNGQIRSFTPDELQSGALEIWIAQIKSTDLSGPCSGVGLSLNTNLNTFIAQNTIAVLTSVLTVMGDISENITEQMSGLSTIEGVIQTEEKVSSEKEEEKKKTPNNYVNSSNGDSNNPTSKGDNPKNQENGTTNNINGNKTTSGGNEGENNVQTNPTSSQQVGGNNSSNGGTVGSSNNTTSGGEQTSESSITKPSGSSQVPSNQPSSNPVSSGNQTVSQTNNNQGNNSVSSSNPVNSGNNSTVNSNNSTTSNTNNSTTSNTNNSTTSNTNNSTSGQNNQNSQNGSQNNQNSPVVTENQNSQGQNNVSNNQSNVVSDNQSQGQNVFDKDKLNGALNTGATMTSQVKNKVASVKKGSLIMNGDIVTIQNTSDTSQFKVNAGIISSNTKNTFSKGVLINFTSSINNSCITLFVAKKYKKFTTILANSSMINFDKDFFNTLSLMESYKIKKYTATVGLNLTNGNLGKSKFQSLSGLIGVVGTYKVNKKLSNTTMLVAVYSPYVYYYQGIWYESGFLFVPFTSVDYKITKKFKMNLSFSGVHQINDQTLSYQILIGAKTFL